MCSKASTGGHWFNEISSISCVTMCPLTFSGHTPIACVLAIPSTFIGFELANEQLCQSHLLKQFEAAVGMEAFGCLKSQR